MDFAEYPPINANCDERIKFVIKLFLPFSLLASACRFLVVKVTRSLPFLALKGISVVPGELGRSLM